MLTIQASFLQVKDRFIYEERGERRIVLKMFVLLYNLHVRMVGMNQIQNTYMGHLHCDTNKDVCFLAWAWERSHRMGGGGTSITIDVM